MNDKTADLLARLQNGVIAGKESIDVSITKMGTAILKILKKEGMIENYVESDNGMYTVTLKYTEGDPEVTKFVRVSKPGRRVYVSAYEIKPVMNGRGISIVSTSQGVMVGPVAKSKKLGGELICEVW